MNIYIIKSKSSGTNLDTILIKNSVAFFSILFQVLVDTWFSSMFIRVFKRYSILTEESNFLILPFIYGLFRT